MESVMKKDPKLVTQVTELIQSGLDPEAIAQALLEQNRKQSEGELTSNELFSDKILMTSQALAFRSPTLADIPSIVDIINAAYEREVHGPEAFREGITVKKDEIESMMNDGNYKWLVVEAPDGRGIESDGHMLGVCAFSTDGISRKNGVEEGHVGSIRYLAVLPAYQGALIGHRLLRKVEDSMMTLYNCCRAMISVPECRSSMIEWIVNRDYTDCSTIPYPTQATGHILTKDTPLVIFHKPLEKYLPPKSSIPKTTTTTMTISSDSESTDLPALAPGKNSHLPPVFRIMKEFEDQSRQNRGKSEES